ILFSYHSHQKRTMNPMKASKKHPLPGVWSQRINYEGRTYRAPVIDTPYPGVTPVASSNQVTLRHTDQTAYRCFLPDLTGFTAVCCARPDCQHYVQRSGPE